MSGVTASTPELAALRLSREALGQGFHAGVLHSYCDADGQAIFWKIRLSREDGAKSVRPMLKKDGKFGIGEPPAPARGKPLYRLPDLLAAPSSAPVWVVEGEACADALVALGIVATTSGGSSSAGAADWTPLAGRRVVIWPDNDAAGRSYGETVVSILRGSQIQLVDVEKLRVPEKGDCVDWLRDHPDATGDDVRGLPLVTAKPQLSSSSSGPRLILKRGSDVQPTSVDWLWRGWLAAGKMHLIGGAPGTGKTTLATALASTVTKGGLWPDGTRADAGDVVIWSGEDDNADTLNPRLRAAGADMTRVHVVSGMEEDGSVHPFDPARDIDAVWAALTELPEVRLIIIDPIVSAVGADTHKNGEVRRSLQPLVDLAAAHRCALLGITHFSKGTSGRDPVERITGSLAFGALARLVMVAAKQEAIDGRPERRVLMRAKSNIGEDGGGFVYDLRQEVLPGYSEIYASRVQWGAPIEGSARELLSEAESIDPDRTASDEAQEWLRYALESGPVPAGEVIKLAKLSGIADKALRTARERMGIKPKREGFGAGSRIIWSLPPIDAPSPHRCRPAVRASMEANGIYEAAQGADLEIF